jgi:hypothetical protein
MNPKNKAQLIIKGMILLLLTLACNATFNVGYPTPTVEPPTAIPTNTSIPISEELTLVSQPYIESNQDPVFTITAQIPQLSGSGDPRVQVFNQRLDGLVQKEIAVFRQEFTRGPIIEATTNSFLEVTYDMVSQYADIWSMKFFYSFYNNGAAHPGNFSQTINYDLGSGSELALGDLFLPGSNYLETISNYCIADLRKQPFFDGTSSTGAVPTLENYRNWNIAPEGLIITFDSYQVAPGAAGPQIVLVPYGQIQNMIDPQGALGKFID